MSVDVRTPTGPQWRHRPPMAPPGYGSGSPGDPTAKRSLNQASSMPYPRNPAHMKKEVLFPPGSVEAATPAKHRRRTLTSKDLGTVPATCTCNVPIQISVQCISYTLLELSIHGL